MRPRSPVAVALALGLALIAGVLGGELTQAPASVISSNSISIGGSLGPFGGHATVCQANERIPASTTALRVSLIANHGPALSATVAQAGHQIASAHHGAGWSSGSITLALRPAIAHAANATICLTRDPVAIEADMLGNLAPGMPAATSNGKPLEGRMRVEYLRPGHRSWLSLTSYVTHRLGLGHSPSGGWIVLALAAMMLLAAGLGAWLLLASTGDDEPRPKWAKRLIHVAPAAAWICASVAILNAVSWSLITPPFQVPDEPSHFAYVKQLAEAHRLPTSHAEDYSPEEKRVLADLHEGGIPILPATGVISSLAEQRQLEHDLTSLARLPREGSPAAGAATSEPPLYYLLETVPYLVGYHGTLLTRLELMRLLSALFAGITAMFVFLFLRETLPKGRASWSTGGLCIAFAPLLGFMSGSVTPDSLLYAVSACLFWSIARAFRRGFTARAAILIGAVTAAGLLTKVNFVGLFPGALLGLAVLAARAARTSRAARPAAYRALASGAGIALAPLLVFALLSLASSRSTFSLLSSSTSAVAHGSVLTAISSTWQMFLPRLPGMSVEDPGVFTTQQIWFNGFVGQYGWVETAFPGWVYGLALIPGIAILLGCASVLARLRKTVRERLSELLVYAAMAVGLIALIGGAAFYEPGAGSFTQARYLLPLLAIFAAALSLSTRAAGRRREAVLGTVLVIALFADDIFSQLLVIARYYG